MSQFSHSLITIGLSCAIAFKFNLWTATVGASLPWLLQGFDVSALRGTSSEAMLCCMELVTVFSTFNPAEAELIRVRLELADFDVCIKNEDSARAWGGGIVSGGLFVQVPDDQAADAKALLDSTDETGASGLPPTSASQGAEPGPVS
jgi:hypothetical protein